MSEQTLDGFRGRLGQWLVIGSTAALVLLSLIVIGAAMTVARSEGASEDERRAVLETSQLLLSSLLPLFATWVGTVLAFYFSKENFQAATQGTLDIVKLTNQRLLSKRINNEMMPRAQIVHQQVPPEGPQAIPLKSVDAHFKKIGANGQPISRLHFFDVNGRCLGVLHRATWDRMMVEGLLAAPPLDPEKDTFDRLANLPFATQLGATYGDFIRQSVVYVGVDRTLAEAKALMEGKPGCQDVIVTQTGLPGEPVLGWISNVDITRLSHAD